MNALEERLENLGNLENVGDGSPAPEEAAEGQQQEANEKKNFEKVLEYAACATGMTVEEFKRKVAESI